MENYKLVIWSFENLIFKCSGIAKILPPILVRTVLFNRNYKEKLFGQLLMITLYVRVAGQPAGLNENIVITSSIKVGVEVEAELANIR